ncbi:MAG: hypothetical protein ACP5HP_05555, partial [Thermogladius sp.]
EVKAALYYTLLKRIGYEPKMHEDRGVVHIRLYGGEARRLAERALSLVKVFNVKSVEEAVGLLPPRGLGTILRVSGPSEKSQAGGEQGGAASPTRS